MYLKRKKCIIFTGLFPFGEGAAVCETAPPGGGRCGCLLTGPCLCSRAGQGAGFLCGGDQLHPSGESQFPNSSELHAFKEMGAQGR